MRTCRSAVAALALLGTSNPVQAMDAPLVLEPSSKWVVNYADDSCRLIRTFGEGEQQIRLEFRMFAPEEFFWLVVSGKPIGPSAATGKTAVTSRFDPADKDFNQKALSGKLDDSAPAVMFSTSFGAYVPQNAGTDAEKGHDAPGRSADGFDVGREAQINALEIKVAGRTPLTLKTGSMHAPMDAVRACLDDLLGSWGVDAKIQKSLTRPPAPAGNPASWITSNDYPAEMMFAGVSDVVNFRLTVDATGKPTDCNVLTMESRPEFIKATCDNLMKRARFKPALDAQGNPVTSIYINAVTWRA